MADVGVQRKQPQDGAAGVAGGAARAAGSRGVAQMRPSGGGVEFGQGLGQAVQPIAGGLGDPSADHGALVAHRFVGGGADPEPELAVDHIVQGGQAHQVGLDGLAGGGRDRKRQTTRHQTALTARCAAGLEECAA